MEPVHFAAATGAQPPTTQTPFGPEKDPVPAGQTFDPLAIFGPHGTGPGYTTSNTPAPVQAAPAFSLPNPFRTDLPFGLRPEEFATESTALCLAAILGGLARLEADPAAQPTGAGLMPWLVDFYSGSGRKRITWNAGDLYLYYQKHAGFTVGA